MITMTVTFKEDRGQVQVELNSPKTQATEMEAKRATEFRELFVRWMEDRKAIQTNSN